MDPVNLAKNAGAILGTASLLGYACGYLAMRSRAFVLGIDPSFKLVDEAYVFAGFRVLLMTLFLLVLTAPLLLVLHALLLAFVRTAPEPLQWVALALLGASTLAAFSVLGADAGLLGREDLPKGGLREALVGGATGLRFLLMAGLVLATAAGALWLVARWGLPDRGAHTAGLVLVLSLQIVLLPICHGAFFAERRVSVLAAAPASARALKPPLAIALRTGDDAVLLGQNAEGERQLVTIARTDLAGVPLGPHQTLLDFLHDLEVDRLAGAYRRTAALGATRAAEATEVSMGEGAESRTTWQRLVERLGIVLDAIGSLGDDERAGGELWGADLDVEGNPRAKRRIGTATDLSWPVVDPTGGYLALQRGRVVRLDNDGTVVGTINESVRWRRLVGVDAGGSALGIVRADGAARLAVLLPTGEVAVAPGAPDDAESEALAALVSNARKYEDDRVLLVDRSGRSARGLDVYLTTPAGRINLSDCDPDSCVQPAMSADARRVTYIRVPRY